MEKFEISVFILLLLSLLLYPVLLICLIWGADVETLGKLLLSNAIVTLMLGLICSVVSHD